MTIKKIVYLFATTFLGLLLGFIVHAGIELIYLNILLAKHVAPVANSILGKTCYLNPVLQLFLLVGSGIGGFFLGLYWWRIVYVERRYCRKK